MNTNAVHLPRCPRLRLREGQPMLCLLPCCVGGVELNEIDFGFCGDD